MIKVLIAALLTTLFSLAPAAAQGDAKLGKKVFKRCAACHSVKEGKAKVGPSMFKIVGAKSGAVEGYKYSKAMAAADLTWDEETLRAFLAKPREVVPKTKMSFAGLKKEADLDNIVAYLKSVSNQ